MNKLQKNIISILLAAIFVSGGPCYASRPVMSDKLSPPAGTDDMVGIEHKDIAELELWLTMCFTQLAPTDIFRVRPDVQHDQIASVRKAFSVLVYNPVSLSVFNPPGAKTFIDEVSLTEEGKFKALIRREDTEYGLREYYAEFNGPEDLTVYPKGKPKALSALDREAIRRYRDMGENIIDNFIGEEIRAGHFVEIAGRAEALDWKNKYDYKQLRRPAEYMPAEIMPIFAEYMGPFLEKYGLTTEKAFEGKNIVFILVPPDKDFPEITEFDKNGAPRKVTVTSHASQRAVYFFIRFKDINLQYITRLARQKKLTGLRRALKDFIYFMELAPKAVHEIGAICGLPYRTIRTGQYQVSILNTLDDAYRRYKDLEFRSIRQRVLRKELSLPGEFTASPVNLDLNLSGRDYAGSPLSREIYAQDPTVIGAMKFDLLRVHNFFKNTPLALVPEKVRDMMIDKRDRATTAVNKMLKLSGPELVIEINYNGILWSEITDACQNIEFALKIGKYEWLANIVKGIAADAEDLIRVSEGEMPISSIMERLDPYELKTIGMIENAASVELEGLFGKPESLRKPFTFFYKVKSFGIKSTKFGFINFGKIHKIGPDRYLVPCYSRPKTYDTEPVTTKLKPTHFILLSYKKSGRIFTRPKGMSITVLTEDETLGMLALFRDRKLKSTGSILNRHPDDRALIDSFIEHERNIDTVIAKAMEDEAAHHYVTERSAVGAIISFQGETLGIFKTIGRIDGKGEDDKFMDAINPPHNDYVLINAGKELPVVTIRTVEGKTEKVEVRSHTGRLNTTYLLLRDDEYKTMLRLSYTGDNALAVAYVKYFRYFVHEIGVRIGLPVIRTENGEAVNELDDAYREWQRTRYIARPEEYPVLEAIAKSSDYIRVDLDLLRGENAAGMPYARDYAGSEVKNAPAAKVKEAIGLASNAERLLFKPLTPRALLIVPNEFFVDRNEFVFHQEYFRSRFDLRVVEKLMPEQYVDSVLEKTRGAVSRPIVLVPEDVPTADLERLKSAGIRFISINKGTLSEMRERSSYHAHFQLDTYAIMVLARNIEPDMDRNSPVYRLLEFYLKTHFDLESGIEIDQFIQAIAKCDIAMLVKGFLAYRPSVIYDPTAYRLIAETLLSSA